MLLVLAGVLGKPVFRFLYYTSGVEGHFQQAHFDSKGWQNNVLDGNPNWPTRLRMVDDLLKRHLLDGRSRKEVESLLGPGSHTEYFPNWDLAYRLGPERGFIRIDSEWLVIRLDSAARVKEYSLKTD